MICRIVRQVVTGMVRGERGSMRRKTSDRFRFLASAGLAVALSVLGGGAADAQVTSREGIALQDQIQQLNQQLNQLQASSGGGVSLAAPATSGGNGAGNSDLTTQLLERVSTLEGQVRTMRGELDQLTNQVQQQNATLSKQLADMQFASQNGGGAAAPVTNGPSPPTQGAHDVARSETKAKPAIELLTDGRAALKSGDYAAAQSAAQQALKTAKSPQGKMDSQILYAQSLAGQKQYKDSALAYYDAYQRLPSSPRAPEALLGVSASMLAVGDKGAACEALGKLKADFPHPSDRVKAASASFSKRADCH